MIPDGPAARVIMRRKEGRNIETTLRLSVDCDDAAFVKETAQQK